jgi:hypothetical protein
MSFMLRPLYPGVGPHSRSQRFGENKNLLSCRELNHVSSVVQPLAQSLYVYYCQVPLRVTSRNTALQIRFMYCMHLQQSKFLPEPRWSLLSNVTDDNSFDLDLDLLGLTVWREHVGPVKNMCL